MKRRYVIVFDGDAYHVRRLARTEHQLGDDTKLYICDEPIANDLPTADRAAACAEDWRVTGRKPVLKKGRGTR